MTTGGGKEGEQGQSGQKRADILVGTQGQGVAENDNGLIPAQKEADRLQRPGKPQGRQSRKRRPQAEARPDQGDRPQESNSGTEIDLRVIPDGAIGDQQGVPPPLYETQRQ